MSNNELLQRAQTALTAALQLYSQLYGIPINSQTIQHHPNFKKMFEEHLQLISDISAQQKAPPQSEMDVTLDSAATEALRHMLGQYIDDFSPVRLQLGNGHSGHGLYASLAEYPDEGAELLVAIPEGGAA